MFRRPCSLRSGPVSRRPPRPRRSPLRRNWSSTTWCSCTSFLSQHREGRLVLQGDTFTWQDRDDSKKNFTFQVSGLEKVWFTCEARTPDNFCYQINFAIVRGDDYSFRDSHRKSGSNASVTKVMEALRTYFPRLVYGARDA